MIERDAIVVGLGFGGLGAALSLAEGGARVACFERLDYAGGCACTFDHDGDQFEGGATLFSGFEPGQLFRRWIDRHGLDVRTRALDPPLELRLPDLVLTARRDRAALRAEFERLPGAPVEALRGFFRLQERVAAALWPTLDDTRLLPPLTPGRVLRHAVRLPGYLRLARLVGRPLWSVLERFGLTGFAPLVHWLDAQCQITVQCGAREAEAPFALAALDYHHRGAVHVDGGIGQLAGALTQAIEELGGDVRFLSPVRGVERAPDGRWEVTVRGETFRAPHLVLNVLPQDAQRLLGEPIPALGRLADRVGAGWSAAMLFRIVDAPEGAGPGPRHIELVAKPDQPFYAGNHVFLSIGARGEGVDARHRLACTDPRRVTVSTHVDGAAYTGADDTERAALASRVQARMRATILERAPEWDDVRRELPGSPRTFRRWVGRSDGLVGGVPRRAGLEHYRGLFSDGLPRGLHLVGDSVFPGQSTLATAAGGARVAASILGR